MLKLFKLWLTLTIVSMIFYIPIYIFSNNALDAAEELTPEDLILLTGTVYDDPEQKARLWGSNGIDMSMELIDALEDNGRLSDVEFQVIESPQAHDLYLSSGLRVVKASAEIEGGYALEMAFGVQPKVFLRSIAEVQGILALQISNGDHSINLIDDKEAELYLFALFEKSGEGGMQSVAHMVNRFEMLLPQQIENEHAQERRKRTMESQQGLYTPEQAAPETAPTSITQSGTSSLVMSAQAMADSKHGIGSQTIAGNPSPDKIIIFQYDGQPAYCADEGIDGANCRGDAATWLGQGTYRDYMDEGSQVCIAHEPGCRLPKFFPSDVRG